MRISSQRLRLILLKNDVSSSERWSKGIISNKNNKKTDGKTIISS